MRAWQQAPPFSRSGGHARRSAVADELEVGTDGAKRWPLSLQLRPLTLARIAPPNLLALEKSRRLAGPAALPFLSHSQGVRLRSSLSMRDDILPLPLLLPLPCAAAASALAGCCCSTCCWCSSSPSCSAGLPPWWAAGVCCKCCSGVAIRWSCAVAILSARRASTNVHAPGPAHATAAARRSGSSSACHQRL